MHKQILKKKNLERSDFDSKNVRKESISRWHQGRGDCQIKVVNGRERDRERGRERRGRRERDMVTERGINTERQRDTEIQGYIETERKSEMKRERGEGV